ncbi:MAG: hypothetical protein DWI24_01455 [Planctomycetota bacterium]|nr:MAG: hypothetical protein DWI24_01455 [Planctomycetota bacterium]
MSWFNEAVDDFHVNLNINTELEIGCSNESVFHYFELFQRVYPAMHKFEAQEDPEWIRVLEEDRDAPGYRWLTVEKNRVAAGHTNPPSLEEAYSLHLKVLDLAPIALSISKLNVKALDLMYGFDMTYEGNHDEVVAKALAPSSFERLLQGPQTRIINYEPNITFAIDDACNVQCRLAIETRTTVPQITSGKFDENQFSVFFTVRQYWSPQEPNFLDAYERMTAIGERIVDLKIVPQIIKPLADAIASR